VVLFDPQTGKELDVEALRTAANPPKVGSPAGKRVNYTAKNRALLEAGIHPATGRRLLRDEPCPVEGCPIEGEHHHVGGDDVVMAAKPTTCRDCTHCEQHSAGGHGYVWKCAKHRLGMSHSEASDIRVGWPACILFAPKDGQ
jgi:hypothetical protein